MPKLKMQDIEKIAKQEKEKAAKYKGMIMVCTGTGCVSAKGFNILEKIRKVVKDKKLDNSYLVVGTGCNGFCAKGPIAIFQPEGTFYQKIKEDDIEELIESHIINSKPLNRLLYRDVHTDKVIENIKDISFFSKQQLIALRNKGLIDPENIDNYISRDGYKAIKDVLKKKDPDSIIKEIISSGIRGRGGGGFPTGVKWESAKKASIERSEDIFIICNASGAFMERSIVETDPHTVIEGMLIGAYAVGASEGIIYIRKEYSLSLNRLKKALEQALEYGLLGENILNSDFNFTIKIHRAADAFISGESSALMATISGKAGEPTSKYIHNFEYGFRNKPTILNNVETWANIPVIINKGSKWFSSIGSGDVSKNPLNGSSGTKVFSLSGDINNSGLIEVPMGITLKEIVEDIGGGIPNCRKVKAIQIGGPSGGCLPAEKLDTRVDYDSLSKVGSMMGSGGMLVMDDKTCMVDVAKYFINFLLEESCGKCTPCREGLFALHNVLKRITEGKGKMGDLELLQEMSDTISETSLCQFGGLAPNPVLSTIKYFRDEYEEHIVEKKCSAGVCKALITYSINDKCTGCTLCAKNCPVNAINGEVKKKHVIDSEICIKCGICAEVCKFDAVEVK